MATVATRIEPAVDEFVSTLKSRMKALGMTPCQLAEKAGVGYPYLYRVLKGEQTPSLEWAAKVGRKVGLRIRTEVAQKCPKRRSRKLPLRTVT